MIDSIEERELDLDELLEVSGVLAMAMTQQEINRRPTYDLVINGKDRIGLHIDTLSDLSFITVDTPKSVDVKCKESLQQSQVKMLGANGLPVDCLGTVELVIGQDSRAQFKGQDPRYQFKGQDPRTQFKHTFLVVERLASNIHCILRLDIQTKLGIQVVNVSKQ